jgi:hypothetical protein
MRPIRVDPVSSMRSHFIANSFVETLTPPSTTCTTRGSQYCGTNWASSALQAGASSLGLGNTPLPAARAATSAESC